MNAEKFQNRYRIPSSRASWHAYDGGAYFITVCTVHREHYFGEINQGEMHLSAIGQFVADTLQNVSDHYPYAEIPLFVVMPNHLHAIVFIDGNKIPSNGRRDAARHVSTIPTENEFAIPTENDSTAKNVKMQEIANQSGWLSVCIGGIKSAVTKHARENNINFEWQSRFHDHIIRDTDEMNRIDDYIGNNVSQWESEMKTKPHM
jgi:putative transposase